jgi:hypothetical protein
MNELINILKIKNIVHINRYKPHKQKFSVVSSNFFVVLGNEFTWAMPSVQPSVI